jgi:hypothetical protein
MPLAWRQAFRDGPPLKLDAVLDLDAMRTTTIFFLAASCSRCFHYTT